MSNSRPKVSIGVPVYNGADFLAEALDSLLNQSFEEFELIISDNASTDQTEEICREYAERDSRIEYHRYDVNRGGAWNQNQVFRLSNGRYFQWAHHDDVRAPECLSWCVDVLDSDESIVLCYPRTTFIDEDGSELDISEMELRVTSSRPNERFHDLLCRYHNCLPLHGLIRRDILEQSDLIGPYAHSDKVLLAQLSLYGRFHRLSEYLFYNRWYEGQSISAHPDPHERTKLWYANPEEDEDGEWTPWSLMFWNSAVSAVRNAPVDWYERMLCFAHVAEWMNAYRGVMVRDFARAYL